MTDIGNMKPRRFVREFQKRAGLLMDGIAGPQTRMALWLIPEPPMGGHWYQPVETTKADPLIPPASTTVHVPPTFADTPTPIDPADIRPGDVVEIREVVTVVEAASDYGHVVRNDGTARTWHLVSRPDPDAEVEDLIGRDGLAALRAQGWDVVRRAES